MEAKEMIESLLSAGLRESEIARFSDATPTGINGIVRGKTKNPLYKTVKKIEFLFNVVTLVQKRRKKS